MPRRGVQPVEPAGQEESWIWGNHRGGGGAPVKDMSGNQVSNLRQVFRGGVQVDSSPMPSPHKLERIASPIRGLENHYTSQPAAQQTPKRIMGSLRHENEIPSERDAKLRKEAEYQAQLREQIEEKRRRKEQEKEEANAIKRRELEEYLAANNMRAPQQRAAPAPSHNTPPAQPYVSQSDKTDRRTKEPNLNINTSATTTTAASLTNNREGYVTQSAYDELTAFCEQLMQRQTQLEEEIAQQAEIIQELKLAVPKQAMFPPINKPSPKYQPLRSQSVHEKKERKPASQRPQSQKVTSKDNKEVKLKPKPDRAAKREKPQQPVPPAKNSKPQPKNKPVEMPSKAPVSGFAKLQASAARGPIVTTYEEEPSQSQVQQSPPRPRMRELRAESEHIYMKSNEIDMISEDQLNRLLTRAKKAH